MYLYKLCGKGETYLLSILKGSDNIMLRTLSFWICASKQHQILEIWHIPVIRWRGGKAFTQIHYKKLVSANGPISDTYLPCHLMTETYPVSDVCCSKY